jgi:hypothetical protein
VRHTRRGDDDMKRFSMVLLSAVFALGMSAGLSTAADAPAKAVTVKVEGGKRAAVSFDHQQHKAVTKCEDCHHKEANPKNDMKCTNCHKLAAEGKASKAQDAMHAKDKGACYSCHFGEKAEKKLKCNDCHK